MPHVTSFFMLQPWSLILLPQHLHPILFLFILYFCSYLFGSFIFTLVQSITVPDGIPHLLMPRSSLHAATLNLTQCILKAQHLNCDLISTQTIMGLNVKKHFLINHSEFLLLPTDKKLPLSKIH